MNQIAGCAADNWSPTIGDPTVLGWVTTVAYFCAALLASFALRVNFKGLETQRIAYLQFWWLMIVSFILLGFNKQLDLQSLFTAIGRCLAIRDGWYSDRQRVQIIFVVFAIGFGGMLILSALVYFRKIFGLVRIAAVGFVFVTTFVVVRAVSFHHVDQILGSHVLGMRINGLLELPGIILVALNATWLAVTTPKSQ